MNRQSKNSDSSGHISLSIPVEDETLFAHKATDDVLLLLSRNPFQEYSMSTLAERTGHSVSAVGRAVDVLVANHLARESKDGTKRRVAINRDRLSIPADPILQIPQVAFQKPVKAAVDELTAELEGLVGIVLYGSVARGEADRLSDIDLWVLVREDRAKNQREANAIATELVEQSFDGDRFEYDIDVESVRSLPTYTDAVNEILAAGIPVYTTTDFETIESLLEETTE